MSPGHLFFLLYVQIRDALKVQLRLDMAVRTNLSSSSLKPQAYNLHLTNKRSHLPMRGTYCS